MKLYSFSGSCGLATNIVLEWAGEPYTLELLPKEDIYKPAFLKLNPNHQVPVIDEDGWVLSQNGAILPYVAGKHPEAKLHGEGDARKRAEIDHWLGIINSDMHPAYKPLFGGTAYLGDDAMVEQTKADARKRLRVYFEEANQQLAGKDYLLGTRSIADPYLFVVLMWAHVVDVDLSGLDNLKKFDRTMRADAGVKAALKAQRLNK